MFCFVVKDLLESLKELSNDNCRGEYHLVDVLPIIADKGLKVGSVKACNPDEILGVDDRVQLARVSGIMRKKILERHMKSGVTVIDPDSTYIDNEVKIGADTLIYPGTVIEGRTVIGEACVIGPDSRLVSSCMGNNSEITYSVVLDSSIGDGTHVGPFAYIRPGSSIGRDVKIGDFVEVKKSVIGDGTKVSHLTYIGDAEVGKNVNMGCGVVTVNYNGSTKHKTIIGDNAFVGCNVNLVAPVIVRDNAYIAAGSTITEEVPENSLAIARSRQVIKEEWVTRKGIRKKE
jgi:bifunctional UDP-N-acetylglucosamine pyrophosphorylase/glucosamine-1-phosphate N-acetyltransferase